MTSVNFIIKEGWMLLPNQTKLDKILSNIDKLNGYCPCQVKHPKCACSEYLDNNICHCELYVKNDNSLSEVQGIEAQ